MSAIIAECRNCDHYQSIGEFKKGVLQKRCFREWNNIDRGAATVGVVGDEDYCDHFSDDKVRAESQAACSVTIDRDDFSTILACLRGWTATTRQYADYLDEKYTTKPVRDWH